MAIHMAMVMSMTMCGVYLFDLGYLVLEVSVETCVGCWGDSSTLGIESNGKQMSGLVWSRLWAEGPRMFMFVFECSIAGKILYCLYLWLALRLDKIAPSGVEWVGFACASRLIAGDRGAWCLSINRLRKYRLNRSLQHYLHLFPNNGV